MTMKKVKNDSTHNIALGTVIIIVAMVIVFSAVFYWMWSMDMLFLPSFIEEMFAIDDERDDHVWDLGALSNLVKEGKNEEGENVTLDITYENLRDAFLAKEREAGIYITADVKYFENGAEFAKRIVYSRDGDRFRIEQHYVTPKNSDASSEIELLKISDGETLYTLDCASGKSSSIPITDSISPENEAGIPDIDSLISAVASFDLGNDSSNTENTSKISDTTLKLLRTEKGNIYYISYTYSDIDITEEYYVSLDERIIIFANTKQNGKDVYSYEILGFSTDAKSYSDDSLYEISESH